MTDSATEAEVTRAGSATSPRSFAEFYETEAESIHRALRSTVANPVVAREAVDEAMARAYERWAVVGGYDAPAGWVYRTALNWSISWWRKHRREQAVPTEETGHGGAGEVDPAGALAIEALRRLPLDQRSVVV
ncbi:MAG TPA: sigma factor, partial [Acidimicrobiales bacterium]|nr:sigma factor [Acidimicrobiales bacterium]